MKTLQDFQNKAEFHDYLGKNLKELIELKKMEIKHSDSVGGFFRGNANKAAAPQGNTITKTIVGNTYNWMDSHMDVHVKGCFTKTIKERGTRIWHLHDHERKITAKVGKPQDIYEDEIEWKTLGIDKEGNTTALFMTSEIQKELNSVIFEAYKAGEIDQHSVGMQYVKIKAAYQSEESAHISAWSEEELKEANENWNKYYPLLGNPEEADKAGVFWVVKEAKLIEISCVLEGSNSLTPTLENKTEPSNNTPPEPSSDTQLAEIYFKTLQQ